MRFDNFFAFKQVVEKNDDVYVPKILIVDDQSFNIEAMLIIL